MNRLFFMLFTILLIFLSVKVSNAEIIFVDDASGAESDSVGFTNLEVPATSGERGEFEILACVTEISGPNFFTEATPGWDNFNLGECGGPNCIMGIFTKFSPAPNNEISTCSWNSPTNVAAGVVLRYRGVSSVQPVFNIACNTGISKFATSPPIDTLEGSFVVRVFGANEFWEANLIDLPGLFEFGKDRHGTLFGATGSIAGVFMYGEPFPDGGTAEEVSIEYTVVDTAWRACTITLVMSGSEPPTPTNVPTLSEWGLIALAGVLGIVGYLVMRRRKVTG